MNFIAFSPAAALLVVGIAAAHRLTEAEACALLRVLHETHPHGVVSVASVERHAADVLIRRVREGLAARAICNGAVAAD